MAEEIGGFHTVQRHAPHGGDDAHAPDHVLGELTDAGVAVVPLLGLEGDDVVALMDAACLILCALPLHDRQAGGTDGRIHFGQQLRRGHESVQNDPQRRLRAQGQTGLPGIGAHTIDHGMAVPLAQPHEHATCEAPAPGLEHEQTAPERQPPEAGIGHLEQTEQGQVEHRKNQNGGERTLEIGPEGLAPGIGLLDHPEPEEPAQKQRQEDGAARPLPEGLLGLGAIEPVGEHIGQCPTGQKGQHIIQSLHHDLPGGGVVRGSALMLLPIELGRIRRWGGAHGKGLSGLQDCREKFCCHRQVLAHMSCSVRWACQPSCSRALSALA